jgi:hypothetical protein
VFYSRSIVLRRFKRYLFAEQNCIIQYDLFFYNITHLPSCYCTVKVQNVPTDEKKSAGVLAHSCTAYPVCVGVWLADLDKGAVTVTASSLIKRQAHETLRKGGPEIPVKESTAIYVQHKADPQSFEH